MQKYILILFLILIIPLKSMDPLTPETEKFYNILKIDLNELKGKTKEQRLDMVIKAYRKLALVYHPDKPTGNVEKFHEIQEARDTLEQLLDPTGEALKQLIEEYREKSIVLMAEAGKKEDQPEEAHNLYTEAIIYFTDGIEIFGVDTREYGFDTISLTYFNIVYNYNKQEKYEEVVLFGKDFIVAFQDIINKINQAVAREGMSYFKKYDLHGYDAEDNYKLLLTNFDRVKRTVGLAFDELRKGFIDYRWPLLKASFNKNIEKIKNALKDVEDILEFEYTVNGISKVILDPTEKNEYVKGYLKLADAYLKAGNKAEARKTLEDGLRVNNKLYAEKKISSDFKNEFERKLNVVKSKEAVSSDKNLINALIKLNSSLRMVQKAIVSL